MKIAITGGAGFVGSHLAKAYLDAGHDVLVIDSLAHGSRQHVDARARFYRLDIRDPKVQEVLQLERPDVVSHHAAQLAATFPETSLLADADVQLRGLMNVLEGCVSASVTKLIYASNGSTLYKPMPVAEAIKHKIHIVKEDTPPFPQRPNDISKLAGEWYVRYYSQQYRLEHTILRYAHIFGESNSDLAQHPVTYFVGMLSQGQRPIIRGSACDVRDHIYIDDVTRANLCILERGHNCTVHISTGKGHTLDQVFDVVASQFSSALLPVHLASAHAEPTALVLDNTLAQQQLGWQPQVTFIEGVRRAVASLRGQKVYVLQEEIPEPARVLDAVLVHS
ncbi:MAG TPA: NAD-dependent epimerase/dehydratase family protein [Ktedonobacteraceae bacterium]|nr:NAD-dependent epimerase/dehydratase family protein [Ktedonobacteraceae bacterium]